MGNPKAYLTIKRKEAGYRPVHERTTDFGEVEQTLNTEDRQLQASRCMDCGVPFCHWACPLGNRQPEWNDLLFRGKYREAYQLLTSTDDFPEFTGRVCPALCEKSCVLAQTGEAVTTRENEASIVEHAFAEGYVQPCPPMKRTGKKVAVIGAGPAGMACANQLNQKGHSVTLIEKNEAIGGLLRFGIPDFKLNKNIIDRRLDLMQAEGVTLKTNCEIKDKAQIEALVNEYDAVCVSIGTGVARDLPVPGRELKDVHFALELLQQQNRIIAGATFEAAERISAKGKNVLVIGGGDTGSDCIGTSIRQGAKKVTQIEIMPMPPKGANPATPWPMYPNVLKTSSSHMEGCDRRWLLTTNKFIADKDGKLCGAEVETVEWSKDENGRFVMNKTGKTEIIECELVLLAMGFTNPVQEGLIETLALSVDGRKNIAVNGDMQTSNPKVFAAGDAAQGASLVVRAIASGRKAAAGIDKFLKIGMQIEHL